MKKITLTVFPVLFFLSGLDSSCQDLNTNYRLGNQNKKLKNSIKKPDSKELVSKPGYSEDYQWLGNWEYITNTNYTYTNSGVLLEEIETDAETGENLNKFSWVFDSYGNLIENIQYIWDQGFWIVNSGEKYNYTFDIDTVELVHKYFDNGNWTEDWKIIYTVGPQHEWIEYTEYERIDNYWIGKYKAIDIVWHNWEKFQVESYSMQHWEYQFWRNKSRYSYEYQGDEYVGIKEQYQNNNWVLKNRETYTKSSTKDVYLLESYSAEIWINNEKYTIYFNDLGDVTGNKLEFWEFNGWTIDFYTRYFLSYNENNDIIEIIIQNWYTYGSSWHNVEKFIYSDFQYFELGTSEFVAEVDFKLYPNPANDFITIDLPGITKKYNVHIYNILGQEVFEDKLAQNKSAVDLRGLPDGLYIVQIELDGNTVISKKFMKQ